VIFSVKVTRGFIGAQLAMNRYTLQVETVVDGHVVRASCWEYDSGHNEPPRFLGYIYPGTIPKYLTAALCGIADRWR